MEKQDLECAVEAILFVSGEPVKLSRIAAVMGVEEFDIDAAANRLRDRYSFERRGIRLLKLEDTLQLASSPEYADYIRLALESRKPPQLSQPALEVLSIIAYFQPVTKAYVEQVRGVDSAYTVGLLLERGLIEACGRMAAPGRPVLYKTTHVFLRTFGLESLRELPLLPQVETPEDGRDGIQSAIAELKAKEERTKEESAVKAQAIEARHAAPDSVEEERAIEDTTEEEREV
ncbi:MAG: SMC-Scp complex subunit ScpB [Oscillospiraceae bacterium]|nr:SMC-Scp complex subunit ScpB [Oscillospiraceae bacterium]